MSKINTWLLILAIVLLLFSTLLSAYYTSCFEKAQYRRLPTIRYGAFLLCGTAVLYIAGTIMLFIAMGWKWGLAGLGISWLVILGVNLGITTAYGVRGYVDPLLYERVQEINIVREQHKQELEDFWNVTSPHECASLITSFLDELRRNWAIEYSQLNPERLPDTVKNDFQKSITWAYSIGYMRGKGWISQEHLVDFSINLGDHLAHGVRLAFKGARPNGKAYASGYVAVATRGHLKALQ